MNKKMINEIDIINKINHIFPSHDSRINKPFESDAELLKIGDILLAFNIDEYSREDLFRENNPFILGSNLTVGALSDILAVGGDPLYFAHSMTICESWSEKYILDFCRGVNSVLNLTGCVFTGGDFGKSDSWRYTASVIGKIENTPLMRKGASATEILYLSGEVGRGNCEAMLSLQTDNPKFEKYRHDYCNNFILRYKESTLIREYATSCIDTSDGLYKSLNSIAEINNCGYKIHDIPYHEFAHKIISIAGFPSIMLFLGESGEYELLFTIKAAREKAFLEESAKQGHSFYRIGELTRDKKRVVKTETGDLDFSEFTIHARDFEDINHYIHSILQWLQIHQ